MTVNEFIAQYAKFSKVSQTIIAAKLAQAAILEKVDEWGDELDYAIGLRTAALIRKSSTELHVGQGGTAGEMRNEFEIALENARKLRHRRKIIGFVLI